MKRILFITLVIQYWVAKINDQVLHPFRDLPLPDFNNQYDETML
jgi:hypothetical protein